MADLSQFMPKIDARTKNDLGRKFDGLWTAMGHRAPKTPSEVAEYTKAREDFIVTAVKKAVEGQQSSPMLRGIVGEQKPFGAAYNDAAQAQSRQMMTHEPFTPPQGLNLFQSTPLPPQAPQPPAPAPGLQGQQPPQPQLQGRLNVPSAGMQGLSAPSGADAQFAPILDLLRKSGDLQQAGADESLAGMQAANAAYGEQTGAPPSLLDFVRAEREKNPRPNREDIRLNDNDKGRMLLDFGLGVLSRNTEGAGAAIGKAGKEAMATGDKALAERYQEAMARYSEKMANINADANLTATDYTNKTAAAQRRYEKDIALLQAKERATTAKVPSMGAQAGTMEKAVKENMDWATEQMKQRAETGRTAMQVNALLQKAQMGGAASTEQRYTPAQLMSLATKFESEAQNIQDPAMQADLMDKANKLRTAALRALQMDMQGK